MKKSIIILAIITILTNNLFAWGKRGHEIVVQITKHYLDKSVLKKVQNYLGKISFEEAAIWMDKIKSNHSYYYMKPWHYINIDRDATYVKTREPNIINAMEEAITNLDINSFRSKEAINFNLKLIFHLIGDLHQPLHVAYPDDRGGNYAQVKFLKKKTNLHFVWDESIIQYSNISAVDCIKLGNMLSTKEIKSIQQINPVVWLNDSRSCLSQIYAFKNGNITVSYIKTNMPLVKKQLLKAGLRLAAVLNKVLKE
ncbi:MAG: S1/P1 nuclease [Bacteroidia bacterium]|nr:S1/P1 nuclease [Bacteroidia bacterium]